MRVIQENIELAERTRVAELQVAEMTEKLSKLSAFFFNLSEWIINPVLTESYHVHPLNINEWPECILSHDFTKEYEHCKICQLI